MNVYKKTGADPMDAALICKALGDGNRLRILRVLTGGEMCACELLAHFEITQPTLSHHMGILCRSGLVTARRDGKWTHYAIACDTLRSFQEFIGSLTCTSRKSEK